MYIFFCTIKMFFINLHRILRKHAYNQIYSQIVKIFLNFFKYEKQYIIYSVQFFSRYFYTLDLPITPAPANPTDTNILVLHLQTNIREKVIIVVVPTIVITAPTTEHAVLVCKQIFVQGT